MPASGRLDFEVVRLGEVIGHHRYEFHRNGRELEVLIDVEVAVRLLYVTVYRFRHRAREVWRGGRLVALTSTTHDDGSDFELEVREQGSGMTVRSNGRDASAPLDLVPTSLWNRAAVARMRLLNSIHGAVMPMSVETLGVAEVEASGRSLRAEGFLLDARPDFRREVWYGGNGELLRVRLEGKDGTPVTYRRRD